MPGTKQLNARAVAALKPKASRYEAIDPKVPGLRLRVTPEGRKTWALLYRRAADGKRRRFTIGTYPEVTLADARAAAHDLKKAVASGADPAGDKKAERRADTVELLAIAYINRHARPHKRSWERDREYLERDVLPFIGGFKVANVARRDIREIIERIEGRGSPVQARRTFEVVRGMWRWAIGVDLAPSDPTAGIQLGPASKPRSRALSAEEIQIFWSRLADAPMGEGTKDALRLALITGQRIGEVCGMRWAELEGDNWHLPRERTKNGLAHDVPLSEMAREIIERRRPDTEASGFLFPSSPRNRTTQLLAVQPLDPHSVATALRRARGYFTLEPFTAHDLRRSVVTHMARLGVSSEIAARVLNHRSDVARTVTATVYDQHSYKAEKRAALDRWAGELGRIISGEAAKVLTFPA